jgi:hypothetical protein
MTSWSMLRVSEVVHMRHHGVMPGLAPRDQLHLFRDVAPEIHLPVAALAARLQVVRVRALAPR